MSHVYRTWSYFQGNGMQLSIRIISFAPAKDESVKVMAQLEAAVYTIPHFVLVCRTPFPLTHRLTSLLTREECFNMENDLIEKTTTESPI